MEFNHVSVLLDECIENLNIKEDGVYVDCTMGGAGHSKEIVKRLSDKGLFIGFDQDKNAIATAKERLAKYSDRVRFVHSNFENIKSRFINFAEKDFIYEITNNSNGIILDKYKNVKGSYFFSMRDITENKMGVRDKLINLDNKVEKNPFTNPFKYRTGISYD